MMRTVLQLPPRLTGASRKQEGEGGARGGRGGGEGEGGREQELNRTVVGKSNTDNHSPPCAAESKHKQCRQLSPVLQYTSTHSHMSGGGYVIITQLWCVTVWGLSPWQLYI